MDDAKYTCKGRESGVLTGPEDLVVRGPLPETF
jgi:hypothetical protein